MYTLLLVLYLYYQHVTYNRGSTLLYYNELNSIYIYKYITKYNHSSQQLQQSMVFLQNHYYLHNYILTNIIQIFFYSCVFWGLSGKLLTHELNSATIISFYSQKKKKKNFSSLVIFMIYRIISSKFDTFSFEFHIKQNKNQFPVGFSESGLSCV